MLGLSQWTLVISEVKIRASLLNRFLISCIFLAWGFVKLDLAGKKYTANLEIHVIWSDASNISAPIVNIAPTTTALKKHVSTNQGEIEM